MKALYKVVSAVLPLLLFPVLLFTPFLKIIVSVGSSTDTVVNGTYSVKQLYDLVMPLKDSIQKTGWSFASIPDSVKDAIGAPAVLFVLFLALAIVMALLLFVFGLFTKKKKLCLLFAALGLAFTVGMNISFDALAKPLVSGVVSVTDLFGKDFISVITGLVGGGSVDLGSVLGSGTGLLSIFSSLLGGGSTLINIRLLSLSVTYILMLLIYIVLTVWNIAHLLIEWK